MIAVVMMMILYEYAQNTQYFSTGFFRICGFFVIRRTDVGVVDREAYAFRLLCIWHMRLKAKWGTKAVNATHTHNGECKSEISFFYYNFTHFRHIEPYRGSCLFCKHTNQNVVCVLFWWTSEFEAAEIRKM